MNMARVCNNRRRGISLLEIEVAFVVFGIALTGVAPLVVMFSKQLAKFDSSFNDTTTYYLVPSADLWSRKLGAAATLTSQPPEGNQNGSQTESNTMQILSLDKPIGSETVTAEVSLTGATE